MGKGERLVLYPGSVRIRRELRPLHTKNLLPVLGKPLVQPTPSLTHWTQGMSHTPSSPGCGGWATSPPGNYTNINQTQPQRRGWRQRKQRDSGKQLETGGRKQGREGNSGPRNLSCSSRETPPVSFSGPEADVEGTLTLSKAPADV